MNLKSSGILLKLFCMTVSFAFFTFPQSKSASLIQADLVRIIYNNYQIIETKNIDTSSDGTIKTEITILYHNFNVPITISKNGNILEHAGVSLFRTKYSPIYSSEINNFIEREFLFFLLEDKDKIKAESKQNKVGLYKNNVSMLQSGEILYSGLLPILLNYKTFKFNSYIKGSDSSFYKVELGDTDNNTLLLIFPARVDLITGHDKVELEEQLHNMITGRFRLKPAEHSLTDIKKNIIPVPGTSIFTESGNSYYDFRSSVFYSDSLKTPVNSPVYLMETLDNLFHSLFPTDKIKIKVNQNKYAKPDYSSTLKLDSLIMVLSAENEIYTQYDNNSKDSILVTLIFLNKFLNYQHLLFFYFPIGKYFSGAEFILEAQLYGFIRTDNIGNLYGAFKEKKDKYKVKIEKK